MILKVFLWEVLLQLRCGSEDKTEIIDEGYRISPTGLAVLSKTGKKWSIKGCTPFPVMPKK